MSYALLSIGVGICLLLLIRRDKTKHYDYLTEFNKTYYVESMSVDHQAVNIASLSDQTLTQLIAQRWSNVKRQLGGFPQSKVLIFMMLLSAFSHQINQQFIRGDILLVMPIIVFLGLVLGVRWLSAREKRVFESTFPDALNMLTSAVSAGESIMHAIIYVGNTLDGEVGKEFKMMGSRLQLGESADDVFRKSCCRFPYPAFYFFVITMRANMQRGGQLKDIMQRLNRIMFNARSVDKKKYAMTAEARTSAKIVGAIPFVFLFSLQFLSPDNYEFVMFHPDGKPILYYMLVSEAIGISIVWGLMKGVK